MSELPRGWIEAEAAEVCGLVQSGGTPKEGFAEKPGIPFLKVYNIVNQRIDFDYRPQFIADDVHQSSMSKSQAVPGDVLMNIVGPPLGKVAVIPPTFPAWNVNQALTIFRPSDAVTSEWLYFFLCGGESVKSVINETRGSAGQVNISLSQCRKFGIPLPPLAEQKRIVAKLDALNRKSARARTELARIETLVSRYKQAVLSKAFHVDGRRSQYMEHLGAVAQIRSGHAFSSTDYAPEGVALVRIGDIIAGRVVIDTDTKRLPGSYLNVYHRFALKQGDLCIALSGATTGKVGVFATEEPALLNQRVAVVRCHSAEDQRYVGLFMQYISERMLAAAYGGAQPNISPKWLADQQLSWPSIELRLQTLRRIESAFARIDQLAAEAKRALELVGKLDEAILAKAFRGELIPQDENDEPSEKLLERIQAERKTAPKATRGRGTAA